MAYPGRITQAICLYRRQHEDRRPFVPRDRYTTHSQGRRWQKRTSSPGGKNNVDVMLGGKRRLYTPTPVISHAILAYNRDRQNGIVSDGIVITPSHNPPECGGFQIQPSSRGAGRRARSQVVDRIANANEFPGDQRSRWRQARMLAARALSSDTDAPSKHDYLTAVCQRSRITLSI